MSDSESKLDESGIYRTPRQASTLARILDSVLDAGRVILNGRRGSSGRIDGRPDAIAEQCGELVSHRGEASGMALASEILDAYAELSSEGRWHFFEILQRDFSTDPDKVVQAAERYRKVPRIAELSALRKAIESPRQKLFRRLNMAPGGTGALVAMRGHLLAKLKESPELRAIDADLRHLLIAWFNRGFLTLERINWDSSARVLEKIIEYEAVHEINGWQDLRGRLKEDRRLFAFFHPAMPGDPVMFVEIALGKGSASAIQPLIEADRELLESSEADTATFYSISNCHTGLQGISFGNFLIKQVAEDLRLELQRIKRFETLSPIPGFRQWLQHSLASGEHSGALMDDLETACPALAEDLEEAAESDKVREATLRLCAHYLLNEKRDEYPLDPVARFHLGNGACLDRINWAADGSVAGAARSLGLMVNYVYSPGDIEKNHEAYFADGQIAASANVRKLARV